MTRALIPLALAASLLSGGVALAQQGPPGYGGPPPAQGQQQQGQPDLHAALNIRPEQEAAYRAFMAGSQPSQAQMQQDQQESARLATLRTPERLDMIAAKMARDQAAFRNQALAVKRFYGVLRPDQQRSFDQITAPPADDGQDGGYGDQNPGPNQNRAAPGYAPQPR